MSEEDNPFIKMWKLYAQLNQRRGFDAAVKGLEENVCEEESINYLKNHKEELLNE